MLMIRLQRVGRTNDPSFRVVVTESENGPKSGKFLEIVGSYDARKKESLRLDTDRISHWLARGAQTSPTLHNLLIRKGALKARKIPNGRLPKATPATVATPTKSPASTSEDKTPEVPAEEVTVPAAA